MPETEGGDGQVRKGGAEADQEGLLAWLEYDKILRWAINKVFQGCIKYTA